MKRKFLVLFLAFICLTVFTGCESSNSKKTEKITYKDASLKLITTFEYAKEDGFEFGENVEGGKYAEITFTNKTENIDFDIYYTKSSKEISDSLKEDRKDEKYYKEYKLGGFNAYSYGDYDAGLYLVITLKEEDNNVTELFVSMELDSFDKNAIVYDIFNKRVTQEFFNSIKIEEEK